MKIRYYKDLKKADDWIMLKRNNTFNIGSVINTPIYVSVFKSKFSLSDLDHSSLGETYQICDDKSYKFRPFVSIQLDLKRIKFKKSKSDMEGIRKSSEQLSSDEILEILTGKKVKPSPRPISKRWFSSCISNSTIE